MSQTSLFEPTYFLRDTILCAMRPHLRCSRPDQDVAKLRAQRGVAVDRLAVFRWLQKSSLELKKRTGSHLRDACLDWHVGEADIRVNGKGGSVWRAIDANGQKVDFRQTARRGTKAVRSGLRLPIQCVRLRRPVTIETDKVHTSHRLFRGIKHRYAPHFDSPRHIDRKGRNNRDKGDAAAKKRRLGDCQSFRSLQSAKAILSGIETIQTIKRSHNHHKPTGAKDEIDFTRGLFENAV